VGSNWDSKRLIEKRIKFGSILMTIANRSVYYYIVIPYAGASWCHKMAMVCMVAWSQHHGKVTMVIFDYQLQFL